MRTLDFTHEPTRRSWVSSAQEIDSDFPIQNLPFSVFRERGAEQARWRGGVAIGDQIVCLVALRATGLLDGLAQTACEAAAQERLNDFLALGPEAWRALRQGLSNLLDEHLPEHEQGIMRSTLRAQEDAEYQLPAQVGDYTDFYTSIDHARNIGLMRRPDNPLSPNFEWMPIAYHGRASTLGVGPQSIRRPKGQIRINDAGEPILSSSQFLDYELEIGAWVGQGNQQGHAVPIERATDHIFGLCLLNDWSARDIQFWEMAPLGPFLAKNFATTLSPWIITLDALLPYRRTWTRTQEQPQTLAYLDHASIRAGGAYDIKLEVLLQTEQMRRTHLPPHRLSQTNFAHQYWTIAQMLTHHTVNGCRLAPGDLLGSGTISGPSWDQAGSLLELAQGGKKPIKLPNGEQRSCLADGDTVILSARCSGAGKARIGFGTCTGTISTTPM